MEETDRKHGLGRLAGHSTAATMDIPVLPVGETPRYWSSQVGPVPLGAQERYNQPTAMPSQVANRSIAYQMTLGLRLAPALRQVFRLAVPNTLRGGAQQLIHWQHQWRRPANIVRAMSSEEAAAQKAAEAG